MQYVDEHGEVFEKKDLILQIQSLLNRTDCGEESVLSLEVMEALEFEDLIGIRESLIKKVGKEIEQNQEWLFSLVDS